MNYSALIGNPTDHSVSHVLYKELAKVAGITDFYQHIRVNINSNELEASLRAFNTLRFVGLNVTLPYKLDITNYLDKLDPVVDELGAVNTIKLGQTTIGYNTDWIGIAVDTQYSNLYPRAFTVESGRDQYPVFSFWWKFSSPVQEMDQVALCGDVIDVDGRETLRLTNYEDHWIRL